MSFLVFICFIIAGFSAYPQIFVPFSNWGCKEGFDYETTSTGSVFSEGTFVNTNASGNSVVLSMGNSTGTYTSKVYDIFGGCAPLKSWSKFVWTTPLPYGKEMVPTSENVLDYSAISASLTTSLVELFRFNGSGAIANAATITADVGSSGTAFNTNGSGLTYTTTAKLNSAITFDGVDDRIDMIGYTQTNVSKYTISTWVKSNATGNRVFVQNRGGGAGQSLTLTMGTNPGGCTATNGRVSFGLDTNAIYIGRCMSAGAINDNNWHHVVGVWDGTTGVAVAPAQFTIYIDGVSVATTDRTVGTAPNAPLTGLGDTKIARHDAWGIFFSGSLDETAIWTRALSATEVQQLYQRGANRIKFQVKSCTLANCSDGSYKGPDNTNATYFTEINNNTSPPTGLGSVLPTSPSMLFSTFSIVLAANRYFQYQATFETDNTTFMPALSSTSIHHGCAGGSTTITTDGTWQLPALCTSFTITAKGGGGGSGSRLGAGTSQPGGIGGLAIKTFTGQTPLTVYTIKIGAGGLCVGTSGSGGYAGGAGGLGAATCAVGGDGLGTGTGGGTGGAGNGSGCAGGTGKYGGAGGGSGTSNTGGGGGGATTFSLAAIDYVVAGGGAGAGAADNKTAGIAGTACSAGGGYNGGNGGAASGGTAGGGGGGGGCFCLGGTCNLAPSAGGAAGGAASGVGCATPTNDGSAGSVYIVW